MEVGKYRITQYRTFINGYKDTLYWIGYGPHGVKNEGYNFFLNDNENTQANWQISISTSKIKINFNSIFKLVNSSHSKDYLEANYIYDNYLGSNNIDTSYTGTVTFKRLPL